MGCRDWVPTGSSFSATRCDSCFFAVVTFFVCALRVEVDGFTGLLVFEEPYPEQNRFDWLRLPSLQTKRPSDAQCAMPPFEPEQGCLPRAASACAVKRIPETRRKINFLISISVIYFVILWLCSPSAITVSPGNYAMTDRQTNYYSFRHRYGRSARIKPKNVLSSKPCPEGDKAPGGTKVQLFIVPDRINNRPRDVTSLPLGKVASTHPVTP